MQNEKMKFTFMVNGKESTVVTWPMKRLLDVLREDLQLTGSKEGCGEGECGACAIWIDGKLVNSCLVPVLQVAQKQLLTIEGVSEKKQGSNLQKAFQLHGASQCGICTPGMIVASLALLEKNPNPNQEDVITALAGNLCRCTGYTKIIEAVVEAGRMAL